MKSDMTFDELIDDTIRLVKGEHESRFWDQSVWSEEMYCGTSCCVAGNVCHAAGYVPVDNLTEYDDMDAFFWRRPYGKTVKSANELAAGLLGLSGHKSAWLFESWRSEQEILTALNELKDDVTSTIIPVES